MARSYYSTVFEQSVDAVWRVIRDFNNYPVWVDDAGSSEIEDGKTGEPVGCVRSALYDGRHIRQRLLALSDTERVQTYSFAEEGTLPVADYEATLRITPLSTAIALSSNGGRPSIARRRNATRAWRSSAMPLRGGWSHCGGAYFTSPRWAGRGRPREARAGEGHYTAPHPARA